MTDHRIGLDALYNWTALSVAFATVTSALLEYERDQIRGDDTEEACAPQKLGPLDGC